MRIAKYLLATGLAGVVFNRSLLGTLRAFDRFREHPFGLGAAVGALVGLAGWFVPSALGGGAGLVHLTLAGQVGFAALPLLLGLRFVLTMGSYGTGATTLWAAAPGAVEVPDVRAEQVVYRSKDGTEVRMLVIARPGEGPRPTILYG